MKKKEIKRWRVWRVNDLYLKGHFMPIIIIVRHFVVCAVGTRRINKRVFWGGGGYRLRHAVQTGESSGLAGDNQGRRS